MPLTELIVKQAKAEDKPYIISDGKGLGLEVRPGGKKYWIIRYWVNKKERRTSAGAYPGVTLREAREKNEELRKSLKTGRPMGFDKETFSTVAEEWLEKRMIPKSAESYLRTLRLRLGRLIIPAIGHMKLSDINSAIVLQLCRRFEAKGTLETTSKVKQIIGQIFNYAIATNRADINPTLALRGALQTQKTKHYAAITDPAEIAILMQKIDAYPFAVIRHALKFSALVFCRPGEIRHAEWDSILWDKLEWRTHTKTMKDRQLHIVPLAHQTVELLTSLKKITGHQKWLFPSARNDGRCMSENGIRVALRSMGYGNEDMTAHGFRGMASTILYENNFSSDIIERQLAHAERNKVKAAYNHAEYLPQRREMMQWYADWLDSPK